jgi:spore germination protein YaaH
VDWDPDARTAIITLPGKDAEDDPSSPPPPPPPPPPGSSGISGVVGYYHTTPSHTLLEKYSEDFAQVLYFSYKMDSTGGLINNGISGQFDGQSMSIIRRDGIKPLLVVTTNDSAACAALLRSAASRTAGVKNIMAKIREKGFAGVDLDFEQVATADRDNYTAFVRELRAELANQYILSLSVYADTRWWADKYDYKTLGSLADQVIIMGYDQHYEGGAPGPIAGLSWVRQCIADLLKYIPAEKLYLAIGVYGRSWPVDGSVRATSLTLETVEFWRQRAETSVMREDGVPYFYYTSTNDNKYRVLYYEDVESLAAKIMLAGEYNLAGIALWEMGYVSPSLWEQLKKAVE